MTLCPCFCCCYVCTGSEQSVSLTFHCSGFLHAVLQLCGHLNRGIFNVCAYVSENAQMLSKHVLGRSQVGANVCVRAGHASTAVHANTLSSRCYWSMHVCWGMQQQMPRRVSCSVCARTFFLMPMSVGPCPTGANMNMCPYMCA